MQAAAAGPHHSDDSEEDLIENAPPPAPKTSVPFISTKEKKRIYDALTCAPGSDFRPSKAELVMYFKAFIALHGSIFLWVGYWDMLNDGVEDPSGREWALFEKTPKSTVGYILVGFALIILVDTYYANAAMNSPLDPLEGVIPPWWQWWLSGWRRRFQQTIRYWIRGLLALTGMMLVWVGLNNAEELIGTVGDLVRDIVFCIVGVVLLLVTDTFACMSTVFPSTIVNRRRVHHLTDKSMTFGEWAKDWWTEQRIVFVRCLFSLVGQTMLWNGSFNLFEYYSESSVTREIVYIVVGQVLMALTASYLNVSCIDYEEPLEGVSDRRKLRPNSLLYRVRTSVALVGQLMHNAGFWSLLDIWIGRNSISRNMLYILLGWLLLVATDSFYTNVGVVPPKFFQAHVDDEDAAAAPAAGATAHTVTLSDAVDFKLSDGAWTESESSLRETPAGVPGPDGITNAMAPFPPAAGAAQEAWVADFSASHATSTSPPSGATSPPVLSRHNSSVSQGSLNGADGAASANPPGVAVSSEVVRVEIPNTIDSSTA